jgi:hypothetical protein
MSSPFSKIFSAKNPIRKENSNVEEPKKPEISDAERTGISDEQHHAISSNTDANSVMILVDKKGNRIEPPKAPTKMSPLEQGGYEGGGDIGAAYIPTAHMYTDMFAKIGQAVIDVDARNKKKKQDDKFKEQYGNETWYGDTDSQEYKKAYASHYGVQVPTYKKEK